MIEGCLHYKCGTSELKNMFKLSKSNNIDFTKISEKADDLLNTIPTFKKRRRRRRVVKALKYICLGLLVIIILLVLFFSQNFFNIKNTYLASISGKHDIEYAIELIKRQKFDEAAIFASQARNNFDLALSEAQALKGNFLIAWVSCLEDQVSNIEYLIKTAEILSKAVKEGALIGKELSSISKGRISGNFSKLSEDEKKRILKFIYESGPELNGLKANLDLAFFNLKEVQASGILWPFKNKIKKNKDDLQSNQELISWTIPMSELVPAIVGYPQESRFLVMLQNNDELRPTGGFLGTYGILELKNGEIVRFDTDDIYHLDLLVKDWINISPPWPLKEYLGVDKWFLRDANWSPDWPTAANRIEWFYNKEKGLITVQENNRKFDGVIGLTPELIIDLLKLVGPIVIEGEEYNKDNFSRLLEYKIDNGYLEYGVPLWQKKEVIGLILKELKIKMLDLPADRWAEVIKTFNDNILRKNILVYFNNSQWQTLAKDLRWTGEIITTDGDYLMVVDANMASLKTDAEMSKSINYSLEQSVNGLFVKLTINYAHHGGFNTKTSRYRTYTRVYVPQGSKLVKAKGLSEGEVEVKSELGKTYFGAFVSIEPGEIGSLYFEYKLPVQIEQLVKNGNYELYIQKQPGNDINGLVVDLKLINKVKSYKPTGFYADKINSKRIRWETDLKVDKEFKVISD